MLCSEDMLERSVEQLYWEIVQAYRDMCRLHGSDVQLPEMMKIAPKRSLGFALCSFEQMFGCTITPLAVHDQPHELRASPHKLFTSAGQAMASIAEIKGDDNCFFRCVDGVCFIFALVLVLTRCAVQAFFWFASNTSTYPCLNMPIGFKATAVPSYL